jgi:hypothetical protein
VGRERTIESFRGFFTVIAGDLASKIVFGCSDMWEPHLKVIRGKCSAALHILDRCHIIAKMNKSARRSPCRRIAPHGNRGHRAGAEEVALAAARTRGESEDGTALPVAICFITT